MPKNPPVYNSICENCLRKCKQPVSVHLLACPRHDPRPVQLEIKVPGLSPIPKKRKINADHHR